MTMTCAIYTRYSSDNQREESIEGQLRESKEFAEKNDRLYVNSWGRIKRDHRKFCVKVNNKLPFKQ
uniref:hypothetical protein n=1 Tax=Ruminococcus bromii TaxID=40518 RepID=UPI0040292087